MIPLVFIASVVKELEKIALIKTPLQPHQQRVVDRIQDPEQPGLVVAHGLGSGKTLTSIAAQEALNLPSDIVVPAALQTNYKKEIKKHTSGKGPSRNVQSLQNMTVKGQPPQKEMLIVDEAHRAREPASKTYKTLSRNSASKRLLLTGSPFYNHPSDVAPLVDMAAGNKVLPTEKSEFERRYVTQQKVSPGLWGRLRGIKPGSVPVINPKKEEELGKILSKWVDYHPGTQNEYPSVTREDVKVPMDPEQLKMYDTILGKAPSWVSYKIKKGLPPSKQESKQLNAFLGGIRQVSNSTAPYQTEGEVRDPKIQKAFENLQEFLSQNPNAKAVTYSNYLDAGINPYKQRLDEAKIPYGEFTGQMNKSKRDDLVKQYNANKLKALLLSSAGGEGLDLKGTRLIQILDPHWNDEKLKQVEGRGIRFKSHSDLPPNERNVHVQRYLATRPRSGILEKMHLKKPGGSVDEYLVQRAAEKEKLIEQFRNILPKEKQNDPSS
jgi:superfamily II DNA or RNA helicase